MLKKITFREIKYSLSRFLAILAIVALGVGFFSGLKITKEAMVETTDTYLSDKNFYDFEITSTLGLTDEDAEAFAAVKGVESAEPSISFAALYHLQGEETEAVMRFHQLPENINKVSLKSGRLPQSPTECAVDYALTKDLKIGDTIVLADTNEEKTFNAFQNKEFTVTGFVSSPLYLNFERGTTSLGNGSVAGFAYLPKESFDTDYYTEIYLTLRDKQPIYSDAYDDLTADYEKIFKDLAAERGELRYQAIVSEAEEELAKGQNTYDKNFNQYKAEKAKAENKLSQGYQEIKNGQSELAAKEKELQEQKAELTAGKTQIEAGLADIAAQKEALDQAKEAMTEEEYQNAAARLAAAENDLNQQAAQIEAGLSQIESGFQTINDAKAELNQGLASYNSGKKKADQEFRSAEQKLNDAKKELADAKEEIKDIEKPDTYVLDRNTNTGYVCFESDSDIVNSIAKVFPVFFFLVAALVCMTTMSRMVDEQRTQIGILKALGYGNGAIAAKYLFYPGSAAFIGCIIGFFGGCYLFPKVIWFAYGMMYDFDANLRYVVNIPLGLLSLAVSLLCSMGTGFYCCLNELREVPSQLIRPKTPKDGKRILLERIPFLWSKFSFLYKVSFRNIFRYKKRFLMMIIGISGCTALLLAGLGIQDTIKNVVNFQFDEIQFFDYSVTFNKALSEEDQKDFLSTYQKDFEEAIFLHQGSYDLVYGKAVKAVNLIAADNDNFDDYVSLHRHDGETIPYPQKGETVICKNLAEEYDLKIGDKVTFRNEDRREMTAVISGICENFIYNYAYISPSTYTEGFGTSPPLKTAYVKTGFTDTEKIYRSSADILGAENVLAVGVNDEMRKRVDNMMESLNYVIILVLLSAGALAVIVLYNLTNINIRERVREIATIKVLGFYPRETSQYVFRENIFLTAVSALCGLFLGRILLNFIIDQIQIDLIYFDTRITTLSYCLAVLLTFVFAFLVNLLMMRKLNKISMTESLKSTE